MSPSLKMALMRARAKVGVEAAHHAGDDTPEYVTPKGHFPQHGVMLSMSELEAVLYAIDKILYANGDA